MIRPVHLAARVPDCAATSGLPRVVTVKTTSVLNRPRAFGPAGWTGPKPHAMQEGKAHASRPLHVTGCP